MKKLIFISIVILIATCCSVFAQKRRSSRILTLTIAQRILNQQINEGTVDNVLFTCRACYDPDDKSENDNFPIVTEYGSISQFLARKGYIRNSRNGEEVFTAKAKKSPFFEAFGFRFLNFKNPKILVAKLTGTKYVPIEYDAVPTVITQEYFGGTKRVKSTASFTYENGSWSVCIGCSN